MDQNFIEIIFPDVSAVIKSSTEFSTELNITKNKNEFRNQNWNYPLKSYEIIGDTISAKDFNKIESIFQISKGRLYSFLFKDQYNYKISNEILGTGDGFINQFQIYKTYNYENFSTQMPIFYPVKETLTLTINNNEISENKFSISNGLVIFNEAPKEHDIIKISCDFLHKVRFDQDQLNIRALNKNNFLFESIKLKQIL